MPVLDFGQPMKSIIQTAFVTDDIQKSMGDMTQLLNIGPWFLFENFKLHNLMYHGKPTDFKLTLALGNSGHMQYELILPLDKKASPYRDVEAKRGLGFHHYGVAAVDFDAACRDYAAAGYHEVMSAAVDIGARATYFDTLDPVFGMVELIEMLPEVEALWTMIYQASVGWDGSDPVRTFD